MEQDSCAEFCIYLKELVLCLCAPLFRAVRSVMSYTYGKDEEIEESSNSQDPCHCYRSPDT